MPGESTRRAQKLYNIAERDAYRSFVSLHGPVNGGQRGFRALLREKGWAVPHRYRKQKVTPAQAEKERKFVEEGLGRQGAYTKHRYPEAQDEAPDEG